MHFKGKNADLTFKILKVIANYNLIIQFMIL